MKYEPINEHFVKKEFEDFLEKYGISEGTALFDVEAEYSDILITLAEIIPKEKHDIFGVLIPIIKRKNRVWASVGFMYGYSKALDVVEIAIKSKLRDEF